MALKTCGMLAGRRAASAMAGSVVSSLCAPAHVRQASMNDTGAAVPTGLAGNVTARSVSAPADVAVGRHYSHGMRRRQKGASGIPRRRCLAAFFLGNLVLHSDNLVSHIHALECTLLLCHIQVADDLLDEQAYFRE